nr:hypothetical protein [Tanacetum cinerariifolium]
SGTLLPLSSQLTSLEGVDCLPNEDIFTGLAHMGYEKPSTKLTFYKAFFLGQWKFLIHTILQSLSAKRTSWNEFSSAMASAVICLSTGRKLNFSKYIFDSLVKNVDSSSKFYMYPRFIQLIIQNQLGDLSTHSTKYISPALTQKVFAKMKRVGKGCSRVETPLFEGMLVAEEIKEHTDAKEQIQGNDNDAQGVDADVLGDDEALDACAALTRRVEHLEHDKVAQDLEITKLKTRVKKLERANKVKTLKLRRLRKVGASQRIESSDDTIIEDVINQRRMIDELDRDEGVALMGEKEEEKNAEEVKDIAGDEHEVVEVVTTAKLLTEVVTAASTPVSAASTIIPAAEPKVSAATITAALVKVAAASTRRKRGVVIRDPEEESTTITPADTKSKDKGKCIMVEEPKPMKKKQQVEIDKAYARNLHEELNQGIDWDVAIEHVKQKAKEDQFVQRLDYFKGMSYDYIRLIFEAKFNANMEFLIKSKEQIEEEENRALESINETPAQKAAKQRRLNKEDKDMEEIKQHLEIVPGEDDDVYTEATPLARKVSVVDYHIIHLNNKPRYKIIRADGTHQLYVSFITLLKNFDREDLESLWSIVKERFSTSKPNNFSDDYLLTTLRAMFGKPDGQDNLILLVERRYPLLRFILDQMLNAVRLQVEEQSEMSLELISFGVDAVKELEEKHQVFNAAGEELCAAKKKLMLLS